MFVNYTVQIKTVGHSRSDLISNEDAQVYFVVLLVLICGPISLVGTVTNIINIIVFIKQGFQDTVNISLFGLAVSDLLNLIFLLWLTICYNPLYKYSDVPYLTTEIHYLTGGWTHVAFTRVTGWITAFVTFERCLCITLPLKVRTILTTGRVKICISLIFILVMASVAPIFYTSRHGWKFFQERNRTLIGLIFTDDRVAIDSVTIYINNVFSPLTSFVAVVIFTIVLVVKLNQKTKWRQQTATAGKKAGDSKNQSDKTSTKDRKVVKMVTAISTIFILCFTPSSLSFAYGAAEPEYSVVGSYKNLFNVVFSFTFILEAINSSVNIIVYYKMSTKFRSTLLSLFNVTATESTD